MNYQALLFDPIYTVQGVPVTLRKGVDTYALTALDKTTGVSVGETVEVQTLVPAAVVRRPELVAKGVVIAELRGAILTINGFEWTVTSWRPRPSPGGELDGELFLYLEDKTEAASESESAP